MARQLSDADHALHEAGHAVAASFVGVPVRRVALLPEGGGVTELDPLPDDPSSVRKALVIMMAGDAAGWRTSDLPTIGWRL